MSSGPVGIDAKEYHYAVFNWQPSDALVHTISSRNSWLVTRIQAYMPAGVAGQVTLEAVDVPIAAEGCLSLEPNGAYRADVKFQAGSGAQIIIEYWYQSTPSGLAPTITVDPP